MNIINLDNNATTSVVPEVWEAMQPHLSDGAGNPASSHALGRRARRTLENAREEVADLLDAAPDEVIFTSGATEANNLAIFGLVGSEPGAIVSSAIEHPCVVEPIGQLTRQGFTLVRLSVNRQGIVEPLPEGWPARTRLVSVMLANHETGALQPVAALAATLDPAIPFHCDAAAAAGKMAISFHDLGVTALTISAHKFHGPQGIGALLLRKNAPLRPLLFGGHQQHGKRPGSEPVALAVGLATALRWSLAHAQEHRQHLVALRVRILEHLRAHAAPVVLNGPENTGLPHTLNLSFPGCKADVLLIKLDLAGIACATGSACSSGSLLPSPVLGAMQLPNDVWQSALRFSLGAFTATAEVDEAVKRISNVVNSLRRERFHGSAAQA